MRKYLFFRIAIILLCIPGVAGFSVSSVTGIPPGNPDDLTAVTIACEIPRTGILVYDQLVFTTDLSSPVWEPAVIVHNSETPLTPAAMDGNRLILNGAALNYPEPVPAKLRVSVSGTVPANHTADQVLLDIRQIDSAGTPYAYPAGNYTVPMPASPSADVPGAGATTITAAGETTVGQTIPATTVPITAEPVVSDAIRELPVTLPTPLPGTMPEKAAPVGLPAAIGATMIALMFLRTSFGR